MTTTERNRRIGELLEKISRLNPATKDNNPGIGAGMLNTLIAEAEALKPEKLTIKKIRETIESGWYLRDTLTGGTAEEFARQECGTQFMARAAEIEALTYEIPARYTVELADARAEVVRLRNAAARWFAARAQWLDRLTREQTAFETFQALLDARGYFPSLQRANNAHVALAKFYDEQQAARGDSRRAFIS